VPLIWVDENTSAPPKITGFLERQWNSKENEKTEQKVEQKIPEEMRKEDIRFFLASAEKNKDYSAASMNLAISAIKFFYKRVMENDIISERKRPRQDKRNPVVLSKGEIDDTITAERNFKHQLFIKVVYGCGLRVGEAVTLKPRNIDRRRKALNIVQGKGRKDRQVVLPDTVIAMLDTYFSKYDTSNWLFPGSDPKQHLSIRTAPNTLLKKPLNG